MAKPKARSWAEEIADLDDPTPRGIGTFPELRLPVLNIIQIATQRRVMEGLTKETNRTRISVATIKKTPVVIMKTLGRKSGRKISLTRKR